MTVIVLALSSVAGAQTTTLYVNQNATGADDGTSWLNAYTDLQDALNACSSGFGSGPS